MKILFYISSMGGGGAQRVLWSLANYFCDNLGHNVFIATDLSSPSAYKFADKVNLVDLENGMSNKRGIIHYISTLFSIRRIYEEISPDIVISFQRGMNGMVLLSLLLAKVKIICCEHNFFLRKYGVVEDSLKRMLYWRANVVTVLTRHDLKICKKQKKKNIVYMPNPLQNIKVKIVKRNKQVLAVGVVDRWKTKGFDLLLKAWGTICSKYPEWKLLIAGKGSVESIKVMKDISISNNCTNVEFLGFRKDIAELMQMSSVFALSSRFEGLPMALLEAMQSGCCCVSFDCETGPTEIICNNKNGILVPAQDVEKLSQALSEVISNQELREKFSVKARQFVLDKYSEDYVMNRWRILFSKIKK